MKLHRFIGDFDFSARRLEVSDKQMLHQWRSVLRLSTGDEVILVNEQGSEVLARISALGQDLAELDVVRELRTAATRTKEATLYLSVLKRENFEWAAQKAAELGIGTIQPVITERTVKLNLNLERLRKIVREATEQSGRTSAPEVHPPLELQTALSRAREAGGLNLFFDTKGESLHSRRLAWSLRRAKKAGLFIGPEGGWTENELASAKEAGCKTASFGGFTLRAETAAVAAVYAVLVGV